MDEVGLGVNTLPKKTDGELIMSVHHVTTAEAEKRIAELLALADKGEEVMIDYGNGKVFKIIVQEPVKKKRVAGLSRGKGRMSDDFDEYLGDDFWFGGDK